MYDAEWLCHNEGVPRELGNVLSLSWKKQNIL
jgi:hypothetical protein